MKKYHNILNVSAFVLAITLFSFSPTNIVKAEVDNIRVIGNIRISTETVKVIAGLPETITASSEEINNALKSLNKSGLFSDVIIERIDDLISINVVENVQISDVFFEGNEIASDEDLSQLIKSKPRDAYSREVVLIDINKITNFYRSKGRFNATITPQYIANSDQSVKLIFVITENEILEVSEINFAGNISFSNKKLASVISSRKKGIFSFITDSDNYSESMLFKDKMLLEQFYKENGFMDVSVTSSLGLLSQDKSAVLLSYSIFEGIRYVVGDVEFESQLAGLKFDEYKAYISFKVGDFYNKSKIEKEIKSIEEKVHSSGNPLIKVSSLSKKVTERGVINLKIIFKNNQKLFIERIEIRGNSQTLDKVIRREFDTAEGDVFNPIMLRKTEERLKASGYFERASLKVGPGSSDEKAIIFVNVSEAPTGSLNFGVGYSTDTQLTGSLSMSERNLLGKGQKLNLNLSLSENSQGLSFGFVEPAFLNRAVSAGVNLNFKKVDPSESTYTSNSSSLSPTLGFRAGPNSKMALSYEIEDLKINSKESLSEVLKNDDGNYLNSSIKSSFIYDKRNSIVEPTHGYIVRLSNSLSGVGGNIGYMKSSLRGKFYKGILEDRFVLTAEFEGGTLDSFKGYSRITDRFKLGGRNFRGFQFGEIGPRDVSGDALGGEKYVMSRFEANFPLGLPKELGLYGGMFAEMGSLWSLKSDEKVLNSILYSNKFYRSSAGVSLYWSTPIGPLQFNWSKPIDYIDGVDVTESFSLNLATRF